jgi:hypothetical protein
VRALREPGMVWRRRGLSELARKVFLDRNARGMPKKDRATIKAECRPHLRQAIRVARQSRDALMQGDIERHELLRDRARMYLAFAMVEFFQPCANKLGKQRYLDFPAQASEGGRKAAEARNTRDDLTELDRLIRACIKRGDPFRIREWVDAFPISRGALYRRIKKLGR